MLILLDLQFLSCLTAIAPRSISNSWHFLGRSRDLYVVAAKACALGDLAQQAEAALYARTSLTLAEESSDPGAVALALSMLSKVAFWDGRRQDAAALAARGYATASAGGPLRVLLACQEAGAGADHGRAWRC